VLQRPLPDDQLKIVMSARPSEARPFAECELPPGQGPPSGISQITVAIESNGQRPSGRIRIPGRIASNFETANGKANAELLNVGGSQTGFAAITAVEIEFTEAAATIMAIHY
jgi:hypothetical protein